MDVAGTTGEHRLAVSRRIGAPAGAVWALVSDPEGHVRLDGSGMLEAVRAGEVLTRVGQVFDVAMDRAPLGDLPMGRYLMRNEVTALEPGRLVEWAPNLPDRRVGHVYGWELRPEGGDACTVTNYTDWSGVPAAHRSRWPIVPREMMERSLDRLQELVERSGA